MPLSNRAKRRKLERDLAKGKNVRSISPLQIAYQLKYQLNDVQSKQLLAKLTPDAKAYYKGIPLPKKIHEIKSFGSTFVNDSLEKEINLYEEYIIEYSNEINLFLDLQEQFETHFLLGAYREAELILNKIDDSVCVSVWSIEKRLLLTEYQHGFKKNKELLSEIIQDENHQLINVLARYQSIRVEKNLSHVNFISILEKYLENYKDNNFKEYLRMKLNYFGKLSYSDKGFMLSYESDGSIIDRYLSFAATAISLLCEASVAGSLLNKLSHSIERIQQVVQDKKLTNLQFALGKTPSIPVDDREKQFIELLDAFVVEDYSNCFNLGCEYLLKYPSVFDAYELVVKSAIHIQVRLPKLFNKDSIADRTLQYLHDIVAKNDETQESLVNSYKIFNSIGSSGWTYKFFAFINNEYSFRDPSFNYFKFAYINSGHLNPSLAITIADREISSRLLAHLWKSYPKSSSVEFWIKKVNQLRLIDIPQKNQTFTEKLFSIKVKQALSQYNEALELYVALLGEVDSSTPAYIREDITFGQLVCHYNLSCLTTL